MTTTWTLKYKNTERPLSSWGLSQIKKLTINQGLDKLTFIHNNTKLENPPLFDPESPLTLLKNNTPWFFGIVTKTPGYGTDRQESQLYEIAGPWWHLENLVYQQSWNQAITLDNTETLHTIHTGRIILGQDIHGNPIHNGQQISEILQYAIQQGAPIAIGEITLDVLFPSDETKDISCSEAIQRLLRWSPDSILWFDYSTTPPSLNIKKRTEIPKSNLYLNQNTSIKSLKITPRYDLQSSAVVIKYEKLHQINSQSWASTEIDSYPPSATGREFKALVLTIELDGSLTQKVKQSIRTEPIHLHNPHWWKKHLPALHQVPLEKITIKSPSRSGNLPAELIEGNISPWMNRAVEEDIIRAKLSYETEYEHIFDRDIAIKIHTTNANTRVYEQITNSELPEPTPIGLAKKLYDALSLLQFDGEVILQNQEVHSSTLMGSVLNIFNANKTWETMNATIQNVREDLDKGQTTITFGPAKHLGPDDLVELLRTNRKRHATRNSTRRITGKPTKLTELIQPTHSRIENTDIGPTHFARLTFINNQNPTKKIILDANKIKENTSLELQEEDYCSNGILKKRLVLASPPYTPTEKGR